MAHIALISEHHLNDGQAIADLLERYFYNKDSKKISVNKKARNAKEALQISFGYTESDMRELVFAFDTDILKQNYTVWANFLVDFEQKLLEC